jgi:glucan phosphoethanolaminetransferase (alkaline phosphatase superfamily)
MFSERRKNSMYFSDKILLLAYFVAVFILNLFVYMIAEYYRKMVDKKLNPIGFIISMCAISVAIGGMFVEDEALFARIMVATLTTAGIASLLSGMELYFFTRKDGSEDEG